MSRPMLNGTSRCGQRFANAMGVPFTLLNITTGSLRNILANGVRVNSLLHPAQYQMFLMNFTRCPPAGRLRAVPGPASSATARRRQQLLRQRYLASRAISARPSDLRLPTRRRLLNTAYPNLILGRCSLSFLKISGDFGTAASDCSRLPSGANRRVYDRPRWRPPPTACTTPPRQRGGLAGATS